MYQANYRFSNHLYTAQQEALLSQLVVPTLAKLLMSAFIKEKEIRSVKFHFEKRKHLQLCEI